MRKSAFAILILFAFPLLIYPQESIQTITQVKVPDSLKEVRENIISHVQKGELVSMSVAVAQDGKIIWEESFGYADKERKIPATPNSIYALGSLSKSMVSTGMMKLIDEGKVKLDDPADKYLAQSRLKYYEGKRKATVANILSMTAGIPHGLYEISENPKTEDEKNKFFSKIGMSVFPPAEVYEYSNNSMGVVQRMIEKRTGRELTDYMENEIFLPLGMKDTLAEYEPSRSSEIVTAYSPNNNPFPIKYDLPAGGAGFYSSAHDLILFGMFHLKNHLLNQKQIISDSTLDLMHYYDKETTDNWHLGFFGDRKKLISNGNINGANSHLQLKPQENIAVVCLTNKSTPLADEIAGTILEKLSPGSEADRATDRKEYEDKYENPYRPVAELLGQWSGYINLTNKKFLVKMDFANDGKVYIELNNQKKTEVNKAVFNTFRIFKGNFNGYIPISESSADSQMKIRLKLALRGKRLFGSIAGLFSKNNSNYYIPSHIALMKDRTTHK